MEEEKSEEVYIARWRREVRGVEYRFPVVIELNSVAIVGHNRITLLVLCEII